MAKSDDHVPMTTTQRFIVTLQNTDRKTRRALLVVVGLLLLGGIAALVALAWPPAS